MYDPEQITFFAKTDCRGTQTPFGIKANDRTRHVYVIGKTGMGKSTLLENMAVQDIKNGNGLAFIDPHGQTAETLLDYIPEERKDDVVYFAPFDTDNPVSFNVMEDVGADKRHLVVSGLMSVFKKIWVDAWSARMEYILSNTLLALLEYPDSTLLGVNRMLSDKEYRMRVIENITDPAVKSFWVDEFLKYNERYMQEAGDAIKNKIGQFTSNPLIRNIIGQPHSSFDIREIMDQKKIMIMNLSKGLVGEQNANLLGSMLTTRIYLAAMSRADKTAEEMKAAPNFYFYVDEFQSFANATFADILSEARKYKLNLTIAHQYIEQMEEEVRNAVFGNVGTIISFRVGPFDAEILETVYTPKFLAPDIVNLGFAQIYLTLMIDGIGSAPFSAVTLPPIEQTGSSCKGMVVARSRELYTKKRAPVEEMIHAWHAKSFSNKPPYVPKHLREEADGGTLPNTGANAKKPTTGANDTKTNATRPGTNATRPSANGGARNGTHASSANGDRKGSDYKRSEGVANRAGNDSPKKREYASATNGSRDTSRTSQNNHQSTKSEVPAPDRSSREAGDKNGDRKNDDQTPRSDQRSDQSDTATPRKSTTNSEYKSTSGQNGSTSQSDRRPAVSDSDVSQKTAGKTRNEKSLDDLRAVLKNISSSSDEEKKTNHASDRKGEGNAEKNNRDTRTEKKSEPSLKDALAVALAGSTSSLSEKTEVKTVETKESKTSQKEIKKERPTDQVKQSVPQALTSPAKEETGVGTLVQSEQQEYAHMKNIDDPLSVKKLERMMRVTTSDKPPIK